MNEERMAGILNTMILVAILTVVGIIAFAYTGDARGQTINPGESTTVRCAECPECPSLAQAPVAAPQPNPAPAPIPRPGVVCSKTVSRVGDAQAAVNASVPGQTVCMDGTLNLRGQFNMKGQVRVHCKPGAKLVFDGAQNGGVRFASNVSRAELDGCEIVGGWNGVHVAGNDNIVRNNYIHDSVYTGIIVASASRNRLIENRIEKNGTRCYGEGWGGLSPRHCHSVYLSLPKGYCKEMTGNQVVNNVLGPEAGIGVNFNGDECRGQGFLIRDTLVEGNEITDTNTGISLWHGTANTVIKNNSITILNPPASNTPVGLKYGVTVWADGQTNEPRMSGNTFRLRPGYGEFQRY